VSYYISETVDLSFEAALAAVRAALARHGFGVLTDIDVQATMKLKLGVAMGGYRILGACNPPMAHRALQIEDKIGTMLPCNVVVREDNGRVEIAAIDPVASMKAVENAELHKVAGEVREMLRAVVKEAASAD
jgi:uncharacterized protein (DUF302 family)